MNVQTLIAEHGYLMLTLIVLADQSGLPLPALPFLLAAGALVQTGTLHGPILFLLSVLASLAGHGAWYVAGRLRGISVLRRVCQLALEPDACVRRTQDMFTKLGPWSLIALRFLPGLDVMAQPLAGMSGMSPERYLLLTLTGAVLWVGAPLSLGYLFGPQIQQLSAPVLRLGKFMVPVVVVGGFILYVLYKLVQRWRMLRDIAVSRITVEELKTRMDRGDEIVLVDLRHPLEAKLYPHTIPGARRLGRSELESHLVKLGKPQDQEVVVFCNCPHEIASARLAMSLAQKGITNVRPLTGGMDAWEEHAFPTVPL